MTVAGGGEVGQLRGELDQLRAQFVARAITERATGILMERLGCPADEARVQLAWLATEAGTDPASIAADIAGERMPALPGPARRAAARADVAAAEAHDAGGLAEALLTEALAAEGAEAVAIWVLAADGGIELAGEAGFGPREAARWRRIPPDVPSLALRVVHGDTEIWWAAGKPAGDDSFLIGQPGVARAVLPLRHACGCIGALEACWPRGADRVPRLRSAANWPVGPVLRPGAHRGPSRGGLFPGLDASRPQGDRTAHRVARGSPMAREHGRLGRGPSYWPGLLD